MFLLPILVLQLFGLKGKIILKKGISYPLFNFTIFLLLLFLIFSNMKILVKFFLPILSIILPFFLGFILAYALYPLILFFKKKFSTIISYSIVLLSFFLVVCFFIFYLLPILFQQVLGFSVQILRVIPSFQNEVRQLIIHFSSLLLKRIDFAFTFDIISNFTQFVGKLCLFFISFFYFFFSMGKIKKKYINNSFMISLDKTMFTYVKSIGLFMLEQFLEYTILFFLIGHPYFLILGIITGLFVVFPYIGGILSSFLALVSAYFISRPLFYGTLVICFLFPVIDEYIISPRIYGKKNEISFLVTIFILTLGGSLFGILGLVLAIPSYLVIRFIVIYFKDDIKKYFRFFKDNI